MLGTDNEIHLVEYDEEKNDTYCLRLFKHESEIWDLSTCPRNESLFFSTYNTGEKFKTTLYEMPKKNNKDEGKAEILKELLTFPSENRALK